MTGGPGPTPEGAPFVVRVSKVRRLAWIGLVTGATALVGGGAAVALVGGLTGSAAAAGQLAVLLAGLLVMAWLVALPAVALLQVHPVLAIGPAGIWIAAGPVWRAPVWLPWEAVDQISVHRRGLAPVVWVSSGALAARRGNREIALWGVDRSTAEVQAALTHYRSRHSD